MASPLAQSTVTVLSSSKLSFFSEIFKCPHCFLNQKALEEQGDEKARAIHNAVHCENQAMCVYLFWKGTEFDR